jgi:hypothetical protein
MSNHISFLHNSTFPTPNHHNKKKKNSLITSFI